MALSANAARALEQVKMGLFMLYGAAYFTEDEWIKIDGLIHKGQYVFTRGPQNIVEEELISFESPMEGKAQLNVQTHADASLDIIKTDQITITERSIPSPISSEPAESTDCPAEILNGTSVEAFSDDEPTHKQATEHEPTLDWASEMAEAVSKEPVETPKRSTPQVPAAGGLALGYTQAQLDEVKAFNAGLTKAGKKSRPNYTKEKESSHEWSDGDATRSDKTNDDVYPSPTPSQQETRIQSWASQVNTHEPSVPEIASPKPTKDTAQPKITSLDAPNAKAAVEAFTKLYGRKPKSIGDIYQPKNPQFISPEKRPLSRASNGTSKTAKSISISKAIVARPSTASTTVTTATTSAPNTKVTPNPDSRLKPGKTFIAQSAFERTGTISLVVRPGDNIKIIKHVSGIMHYGLNQNTNQTGQFPESIFTLPTGKAKQEALIEQQRALAAAKQNSQVTLRNRVQSVTTANGLDRVEGMNAAEWEDVAVVSRRTASTAPPVPVKKPVGGLSASRYAVLADEEEPTVKKEQEDPTSIAISKEEISRLVDEKFAQIMAAQAATTVATKTHSAAPTGPRPKGLLKEPLMPVVPKTNTCYFWATPNQGCRFTAEECRDLHAFIPGSHNPTNLRMGKPTWGALADSLPPASPTPQIEYQPGRISKTCWYWANDGKCEFTAETCKYLHGPSSAGVASKPNNQPWKRIDWSRFRKRDDENATGNETDTENGKDGNSGWGNIAEGSGASGAWGEYTPGEEDGELVLEEVTGNGSASAAWGNANAWGDSSGSAEWGGSGDKYKPPHIKALEEKAQTQAAAW